MSTVTTPHLLNLTVDEFLWAAQYVDYKAEEYGIDVQQVDPENTSQRCSHYGFTNQIIAAVNHSRVGSAVTKTTQITTVQKNIRLQYLR